MDDIIAACGNNCSKCPRHLPKSEAQLIETAKLWFDIGYRDSVVSTGEISCHGCHADNWCRYGIVKCASDNKMATCGHCTHYPCDNIKKCFESTLKWLPKCRAVCSDEQFEQLQAAFFNKKENLDKIKEGNRG